MSHHFKLVCSITCRSSGRDVAICVECTSLPAPFHLFSIFPSPLFLPAERGAIAQSVSLHDRTCIPMSAPRPVKNREFISLEAQKPLGYPHICFLIFSHPDQRSMSSHQHNSSSRVVVFRVQGPFNCQKFLFYCGVGLIILITVFGWHTW